MSFIGNLFTNQDNQATNTAQTNSATQAMQGNNAQLQAESTGGGAVQGATQAALNNATQQGVQNAAGIVASTKGINPGMAARLAGQNATAALQQGANQSAALTAQNAMGAQAQLSNNLNQQYATSQNSINQQQQLSGQAGQAVTGGLLGGAGAALGLARGGMVRYMDDGGIAQGNQTDTSQPFAVLNLPQGQSNAQLSQSMASSGNGFSSGPKSSAGRFLTGASNGMNGNSSQQNPLTSGLTSLGKGLGSVGKSSSSTANPASANLSSGAAMGEAMGASPMDTFMTEQAYTNQANGGLLKQALPMLAMMGMAKGGNVKAMLSPGEKYLPPEAVKKVSERKADPIKAGKTVPGKAPVKGAKDTLKNDIVPATLKEGGVVLPRSVTQSKDPHKEAYKFVDAILAKQGLKKK